MILFLSLELTIIKSVVARDGEHYSFFYPLLTIAGSSSQQDICFVLIFQTYFYKPVVCQGLGYKEEISKITGWEEENGQNM